MFFIQYTSADVEPSIEDVVAAEPVETSQTNVVSLFGRGRRSVDMPEIEIEEVEVEQPVEEAVVVPTAKKDVVAVDDIFAKLRAGSTAEVAAKQLLHQTS